LHFKHRAHEAHALAGQGSNKTLVLPCVSDRASRRVDTGTQRRFRHDPPVPDCSNQIVSADNAIAILDQVLEEIEDLRSHCDEIGPAAQFAPVGIKRKIFEAIKQIAVSPAKNTAHQAL
jgi:hypothetical protein